MERFDYLLDFTLKLQSLFNSDSILSYKKISELNLNCAYKNDYNFINKLNKINDLLDIFYNIFNHPFVETKTITALKRSELVNNYSEESFKKTIQDASLWKSNGKQYKPELVHTFEYDDTIDNYENRFIIYAFNKLLNAINNMLELDVNTSSSIINYFGTSETSLGKLSIYHRIAKEPNELSDYIYNDHDTQNKLLLIKNIKEKVNRLKLHTFYRRLKKSHFSLPLELTNVMIHDRRYNKVYRFFKDCFLLQNIISSDSTYYNFIAIKFVAYLVNNKEISMPENFAFNMINGVVSLTNSINFTYKNIKYLLMFNSKDLSIDIKCKISNCDSFTKIKVFYKYDKQYIDFLNIDNLLIFTSCNNSKSFNNIAELNIYDESSFNEIFGNVLSSTQILIPLNASEISKCPYCGSSSIKSKDFDYYCSSCNNRFSFVTLRNKKYVWIKGLWRAIKHE